MTCVNNTGGVFITGVSNTGNKFMTGVVDTGDRYLNTNIYENAHPHNEMRVRDKL